MKNPMLSVMNVRNTLEPTAAGTPATGKPMTSQEVEAMIAKIADDQDEDYNWKQSIVDLMKLLKLDSSLNSRKQLAQELGYKGALDGSADGSGRSRPLGCSSTSKPRSISSSRSGFWR